MDFEDKEIDLLGKTTEAYEKIFEIGLESVWRILVLDDLANLSLTGLISIRKLRKHNITLYLNLNSEREKLSSVMAIYIIEPTVNNLHRVIQDIENSVYDAFSIHFLYPPSHSIIDSLKTSIISPALQSKIFKIHVQNLNYIVLEENLFTLNSPSFVSLNLAHENSLLFDQIAMSLFSVLKTLKIKPIIKAGKGMSAKVGRKLAEMCWEDMEDAGGLTRPLLLLVDRDVDVSVMLHHPWTYQALAADVYEYENNKLLVTGDPPLLYELDKNNDPFWKTQSDMPFGDVLKNTEESFTLWREKYQSIEQTFKNSLTDINEITDEKKILDTHMSIASRLVTEVHNRNLHTFSENEARLMLGQNPDSEDFLINQSSDDILRYEIIKFMHNKQDSIADKHIQNYLQSLKREVKTNNLKLITGFAKKMKDKIMGREQWFPITKVLYSAMKNTSNELETFDTLNPNTTSYKREFNEAILFVVGGGSYTEYCNVSHFSSEFNKRVIYGSTDVYSPSQFLEQLKNFND